MSLKDSFFPKLNKSSQMNVVPRVVCQESIPRIIHQTFYSRQLPEALQKNVMLLKSMNPGWEYRFYDDEDIEEFLINNYPREVLDQFNRIDLKYGAARADLFRYLLMYKVGGVYLDIKSTATKPLEEVILPSDRFLLSQWNGDVEIFGAWGKHYELEEFGGREFQQWYIACVPGHPFLHAVIENVLRNIDLYIPGLHGTGKGGVLRVTGPIAYSIAIYRLLGQHPYRIVDSKHDLGFEYTVLPLNSHKTEFKSHYSLQKQSLIKLNFVKSYLTHLYSIAQLVHDFLMRQREGKKESA